jgi:hypothetical protein
MEAVNRYLDKIKDTASAGAPLSALDIDLMLEQTRRLYEAILALKTPVVSAPDAADPAPAVEAAPAATVFSVPQAAAELTEEPEPLPVPEELPVLTDTAVQEEEIFADPVMPEATPAEPLVMINTVPASTTAAEEYSSKLTSFNVSGRDIRTYIGINDKYNFISELFNGNTEAYEEILDEINTFETREDASFFLANSGVTTLYQWEEDSFSVRIFHNVLNQFFSAR